MVLAAGSFSKEVLIVLAVAMFIWWLFNIEILSFYNYDFEVALESGFVAFLILFLWSYLRTVFSDPGWTETDMKMLTEETKRTCDLCKNSQPDRCSLIFKLGVSTALFATNASSVWTTITGGSTTASDIATKSTISSVYSMPWLASLTSWYVLYRSSMTLNTFLGMQHFGLHYLRA